MLNAYAAQRGFTIIEIMISLTVLAVLIALGAPGFADWIQAQRIRTSADAITNGLQVARGEAIRQNLAVSLGLQPPTTGWTVCLSTVIPCDSTTLAANIIQSKSPAEGSGSTSVSGVPAGAILATFSPLGNIIDNPDGSARLTQVDVTPSDPSLCSAAGGTMRCLRIVISPAGSIRMCDPTPAIVAPDPRACP
ncbi:MAG TPA: GspH/FimT family pseudopilin [Burkholderiales bacterium]|nr:GspH/FimT family pseudopilin [Burkholderiales bacterium]